ncbi:diaminopimelate dehydrogenase [Azotobacter chroococcum]|uniref:Diaminopimelate dehydrogenase n=1 Tax=Azotobacter chroococcum NCIMB 8003 TaxID=1328314 RepID=A0A0C4WMN4_9GAMM|nr:diaminopimelate dehydrogenase [Azotobacter chroococcum]AJE21674.1 Diaminopimelate dehydrogenase [Azotobacter chroococcum NCIMB 8003]
MKKRRIAVIGLGKLGRSCAEALLADPALALAGVVRRTPAPLDWLGDIPVVGHVSELGVVDAALLCVPPDVVLGMANELLQRRLPVVECARLHGDAFLAHKTEMQRVARLRKTPAVVGAGCDPGILSLFRNQFALLIPHGHTRSSLHHSLAAEGIKGVGKALATELKTQDGRLQRYVYVELEPGADAAAVEQAIRQDPLYLDEETLVFPVESVATLEETNRGLVLERHAAASDAGHAALLLEARFNETELAARMMLAAARALPQLQAGAYSLDDLPARVLWGEQGTSAEREWM